MMTYSLAGLKNKLAEASSDAPSGEALAALEEQKAALERERDELQQQVQRAPISETLSELRIELQVSVRS